MKKSDARSSRLLEMLQMQRKLDVRTVVDSMGISEATARRLFARLDKEGKVIRTHGGVRLAPHLGSDYSYYLSASHRSREKAAIGRAAADLVASGDRLYLDSGTTVLKLAEELALRLQAGTLKDLIALTNSLVLVEALARWCKVILLGGEVRTERRDVCGPISEETLRRFHVTRAFLGADAVHLGSGFMTTDERTAKLNEIILKNAAHSCVLADSEKFHRESFVSYAALGEVELLLTDGSLPETVMREFMDAGARIEAVPAPLRRHGRGEEG
jgi:DeoR family transcriptional regulator, fructose operon transcriptional repressor